ncbi:hypothetical protein [Ectobacillus polymachus]|uniref:hypothetical protein n=1 Tax=Ectobacillus polymachus TaxID=1508806 RepID=UPI003A8566C4
MSMTIALVLGDDIKGFVALSGYVPQFVIVHRLINRIEVKTDGTPIIHYQFAAPKFE